MFQQVFIIQCKSTGEFLSHNGFYVTRFGGAGFFADYLSALDTAINTLDNDFEIFNFYKKQSDLPNYMGVGFNAPPM